jgi:hypothetical protein
MEDKDTFSPATIQAAYQRLGHRLGWRLLTCPARNIESATVALVTINPGGANFEPPRWSVEAGSAYVIERWKGRPPGQETLQRQVRRMFEIMNVKPAEALSGYLVPFRSPSWGALSEKSLDPVRDRHLARNLPKDKGSDRYRVWKGYCTLHNRTTQGHKSRQSSGGMG